MGLTQVNHPGYRGKAARAAWRAAVIVSIGMPFECLADHLPTILSRGWSCFQLTRDGADQDNLLIWQLCCAILNCIIHTHLIAFS